MDTNEPAQNLVSQADSSIWDKIDARVEKHLKDTQVIELTELDPSFIEFYEKFISDSSFQFAHLDHELIGAVGFCESTEILNTSNWEYSTSDFREYFHDDRYENTIAFNENSIIVNLVLIEVGKMATYAFRRHGDAWYLHVLFANAC